MHDGLQQHGGSIHAALLVGNAGSGLESHLVRIYRMVGAIKYYAIDIDHRIPGKKALCHGFLNALIHSRNEVLWDPAANYFACKYVPFAWVGGKTKPAIAKLSRPASLFLMTTLCFCGFLNCLTIRNSNRNKMRFNLRLILQLIQQHIYMHVAHRKYNLLMSLFIPDQT